MFVPGGALRIDPGLPGLYEGLISEPLEETYTAEPADIGANWREDIDEGDIFRIIAPFGEEKEEEGNSEDEDGDGCAFSPVLPIQRQQMIPTI